MEERKHSLAAVAGKNGNGFFVGPVPVIGNHGFTLRIKARRGGESPAVREISAQDHDVALSRCSRKTFSQGCRVLPRETVIQEHGHHPRVRKIVPDKGHERANGVLPLKGLFIHRCPGKAG